MKLTQVGEFWLQIIVVDDAVGDDVVVDVEGVVDVASTISEGWKYITSLLDGFHQFVAVSQSGGWLQSPPKQLQCSLYFEHSYSQPAGSEAGASSQTGTLVGTKDDEG